MSGILAMMTGGAPTDLEVDISNRAKPDIPALVQAAGWVGTSQKIVLRNTGLINTMSILPGALSGADITLINAAGALIGGDLYGSTALTLRIPVKIQNLGSINGAGGQGGTGATAWISRVANGVSQSATGSGAGGRSGQGFINSASLTINTDIYAVYQGTTGTLGATGSFGGGSGGRGTASATGGNGGAGGAWGKAGSPGGNGSISGDYDTGSTGTPGAGTPPGYYIDGASFATWLATGTRLGLSK